MVSPLCGLVFLVVCVHGVQTALQQCGEVAKFSKPSWKFVYHKCPEGVYVVTRCRFFVFEMCVVDPTRTLPATTAKPAPPVCGIKARTKIIGGKSDGCEPWLASVQWRQKSGNTLITCSAVLVSKTSLLAAASCFRYSIVDSQLQVVFGANSTTSDNVSLEQVKPVASVVKHPLYSPDTNVHITACATPICLPSLKTDYATDECMIGGFGKTNASDWTLPETANVANVLMIPDSFCSVQSKRPPKTLCVLQNPDACNGDEGGMVACLSADKKKWQLAGLIGTDNSFACGSGKHPQYPTDITAYKDWIAASI